jgi:hypothetical protein
LFRWKKLFRKESYSLGLPRKICLKGTSNCVQNKKENYAEEESTIYRSCAKQASLSACLPDSWKTEDRALKRLQK